LPFQQKPLNTQAHAGIYSLSFSFIWHHSETYCNIPIPSAAEISNARLSFLLQMLHVKDINWTPRFGAFALASGWS
jgi:hypothetical protein